VIALDFAAEEIDNQDMALTRAARVGLTWSLFLAVVCAGLDVRGLTPACANEQTALKPCGAEVHSCCCGVAASETACGCRRLPARQVPAVPLRDDPAPKSPWVAWSAAGPLVFGIALSSPAAADLGRHLISSSARSIQTLLCVWRR
jgi:hypothetical protein